MEKNLNELDIKFQDFAVFFIKRDGTIKEFWRLKKMSWLLKRKIRNTQKQIEMHNRELMVAINKYNKLVAEFQQLNSFAPIIFQNPHPSQPPTEIPPLEAPTLKEFQQEKLKKIDGRTKQAKQFKDVEMEL